MMSPLGRLPDHPEHSTVMASSSPPSSSVSAVSRLDKGGGRAEGVPRMSLVESHDGGPAPAPPLSSRASPASAAARSPPPTLAAAGQARRHGRRASYGDRTAYGEAATFDIRRHRRSSSGLRSSVGSAASGASLGGVLEDGADSDDDHEGGAAAGAEPMSPLPPRASLTRGDSNSSFSSILGKLGMGASGSGGGGPSVRSSLSVSSKLSRSSSKVKRGLHRRCVSAAQLADRRFRRRSDGCCQEEETSQNSDWSVDKYAAPGSNAIHEPSHSRTTSLQSTKSPAKRPTLLRRLSGISRSSSPGRQSGGKGGTGAFTVEVPGRGIVGISNALKPTDSLTKARARLRKEFGGGGGAGGGRRLRRRSFDGDAADQQQSAASFRRRSSDVAEKEDDESSASASQPGTPAARPQFPLPTHFRFVYAGEAGSDDAGREVPDATEGYTTVAKCCGAGASRLLLRPTRGPGDRPDLPPATDGRVASLPPKVRAVYLLCLRVLEQLEWEASSSRGGGSAASLPPDVLAAIDFIEALALFASLAGPGAEGTASSSWAERFDWTRVESGLFWVEDAARAAARRACHSRLAAWYADGGRPERSELREAVACVKDAVRESAAALSVGSSSASEKRDADAGSAGGGSSRAEAASAAAVVLAVEFDPPSAESEVLRKKMGNLRLRDLHNAGQEELRKEIAAFLGMTEAELLWEARRRRLSSGSADGDADEATAAAAATVARGEFFPKTAASGGGDSGEPRQRRGSTANRFSKRASLAASMPSQGGPNAAGADGDGSATETLVQTLAPLHFLDEDVVAHHAARFHRDTGAWAMESFDNWVDEKNGRHRLYVLAAGPGFGKTAIASRIAAERDDVVVARYFCRHDDRRSACARTMVLSVVYQLAQHFPQFRRRVVNILAKHGLNRAKLMGDKCNLSTIFTELVEIPLHSMKVSSHTKHVIIIDGLDESDDGSVFANAPGSPRRSSSSGRRHSDASSRSKVNKSATPSILDAIQHYFPRLPPWLKLYVTTRPILPVLGRLKKFNAHMMGPDENHVMEDMRSYLSGLLERVGLAGTEGDGKSRRWASDAAETLLMKSNGVFLYASTVADKVVQLHEAGLRGRDLRIEVDRVPTGIDQLLWHELFAADLEEDDDDDDAGKKDDDASLSGPGDEGVEVHDFGASSLQWRVVRLCIAAVEPLHLDTLAALTGCGDDDKIVAVLERSAAFFLVKDSYVQFRHNLIKEWLIKESCADTPDRFKRRQSMQQRRVSRVGSTDLGMFGGMAGDMSPAYGGGGGGLMGQSMIMGAGGGGGGSVGGAGVPEWKRAGRERCAAYMASRCLALLSENDSAFLGLELNRANDLDDTRRYVLNNTIPHLREAKMLDRARTLLFDARWIMTRCSDGAGLVRDCDALAEGNQAVQLLRRAVQLSLPALRVDPRQLPGQLVGRLHDSAAEGRGDDDVRVEIRGLLEGLENHHHSFSWWCPISPTWERAELDFIRRLDGQDSAVQSVACDGTGKRIASGMWDGRAAIWNGVSGKIERVLMGHTESVWAVAWSPCGRRLASASLDRSVRVWDADSGRCELVLEGHEDHAWSVAWSGDGKRLASGSRDKKMRLWNTVTGECERVLEGRGGGIYSISFEDDGDRLASGGTDNCIYIWNAATGDCLKVLCGHTDWVRSVVWSSNGKILSGSADRSVRIWDAVSGECEQVLHGHTDSVWSVSASRDGRHIVSGSTDKTVRVWDVSAGQCEHVLTGHKGSVWSVSYTADGKKVVSGSADTTITIWDAASATSEPALTGHGASVWSIDLSSDGKCIVSGSSDKTVRVWNTVTGFCTRAFTGQGGPVWAVALSKDARRVVSGSTDGKANIYNLMNGEHELELSGHTGKIWCVAWSNDCSRVISGSSDNSLKIWDVATGKCLRTLNGHEGDIRAISLSPDGTKVASGSSDKTMRVWSLGSGNCRHVLKGFKSGVLAAAWSPDGEHLAAGSSEKFVHVFSLKTAECETTLPGHSRRINSVCWSPDGEQIAAASTDKTIRVWDFKSGECRQVITGHTGLGVYSLQWSSDGQRLVSGGTDKTVRVWSASSGRCEHVLTGHTGLGVYSVAWSEDGRRLVSGSRDRTVQVWDADTGECLLVLRGHTNWVYSVAWEKGGGRIASVSDDDTCRIWDASSGECLQVLENTRELPADFATASAPCVTRDLSGRSEDNEPIGIQCDKVQVFKQRACAWMGKSVNFFKLVEN